MAEVRCPRCGKPMKAERLDAHRTRFTHDCDAEERKDVASEPGTADGPRRYG